MKINFDFGRVLIVEDSETLATTYVEFLKERASDTRVVHNAASARLAIDRYKPECVLLDLGLPDLNGLELLRIWEVENREFAIIIITADGTVDNAISATQHGASDFLVKPFSRDRLVTTVANAIENLRLRRAVDAYEDASTNTAFDEFIGDSLPMQAVYKMITVLGSSDAPVLITGETGSGKDLAARAIHRHSARQGKPFITVNCGSLTASDFERQMFGDAASDIAEAIIANANGGTLFLDAFTDLNLDVQPKLLRFLQTGRYQPVGGTTELQADVRVIAATNQDPRQAVEAGSLREDLLFRLDVLPLRLPPLRERGADVLLMLGEFLAKSAGAHERPAPDISEQAQEMLLRHAWPGNVRELQNLAQRLVVMNETGLISEDDLEFGTATDDFPAPAASESEIVVQAQVEPLWKTEKRAIEHALALYRNNVAEAARRLEVSASTIYRKQKRWGSYSD